MKRQAQHYVEIFCTRGGELFKTGEGAAGRTMAETRRLFRQAKQFAVPRESSTFLVDLHNEKGDLIDTVLIDGRGFRALTGKKPPTVAEARAHDRQHWAAMKEKRGWQYRTCEDPTCGLSQQHPVCEPEEDIL